MKDIFLSFSSIDINIIDVIINSLESILGEQRLCYFKQPYINGTTMKDVIKELTKTKFFILFITNNSMKSKSVRKEFKKAIKLKKRGKMKKILPIVLDDSNSIDAKLSKRFRKV